MTVNGNNLWFCYHIQVAQYKTKVCAKDTSQHSLQFNYDAENDTKIAMDADHVKVAVSSHFSNPVKVIKVQVSRKVCCIFYTFVISMQACLHSIYIYRTLAKIRPPFSTRSLGLLGDWAFNRERRVFIRIYAHPRPQIEVYTWLYDNSLCIFILV